MSSGKQKGAQKVAHDFTRLEEALRALIQERDEAIERKDAKAAARAGLELGLRLAEYRVYRSSKTFALGRIMRAGRKPGSIGPIRRRIGKLLRKDPGTTNGELWDAIALDPPKGYEARNNQLGEYLDGPKGKTMSYARFCNVCAEERKLISK